MTKTIDDMIRQEVHYCVSTLVSTLAQGLTGGAFAGANHKFKSAGALAALCEQALELAASADDWEEAAVQAGWQLYTDKFGVACWRHTNGDGETTWAGTPEALAREFDIDPYQREVYEHWAVSDWFATKLAAHGEKIDPDFAGMTIWARTTTGQSISMDGVVQRIYQEASK